MRDKQAKTTNNNTKAFDVDMLCFFVAATIAKKGAAGVVAMQS